MNFNNRNTGFSILLGFLLLAGGGELKAQEAISDVQNSAMKYGRLLRLIDSYYVDTTNVDDLTEKASVEVPRGLDP